MKILIVGADGYLGWPTAMYFSKKGHEVVAVDNYFRRMAAVELDAEPLTACPNLSQRTRLWRELTGLSIEAIIGDITDYGFLSGVFEAHRPECVIHYAEQPSAPYSMMSREAASFTLKNNLLGTLNLVYAVREFVPDCHIIKLGTMGEYGTPNIPIEEGWLDIEHKGRSDRFLFPRQASSLYHTSKIQDTDMLWFYVRTWGIRVTDLMQGPVYGIHTDEASGDPRLMPTFHYDEIFGTVLNRFIVQAVAGYPLTVYGRGGQTRGYLNLLDTLQCVYLSAMQPPAAAELRIFNQVTEVFSVNELAEMVRRVGSDRGHNVVVNHIDNPRKEKEKHYYNPAYSGLLELGLTPHLLSDVVLAEIFGIVEQFSANINRDAIYRGIQWK